MPPQFAPAMVQFEENLYFLDQNRLIEGLDDIVDSAHLIAPEHVLLVRIRGRKKDKRDNPGFGVPPQVFGQFVTVHPRHHHIQEGHCEVVVERGGEGLVAAGCLEDLYV